MTDDENSHKTATPSLLKCPTGIAGLDEVTRGGLPKGRPTLVCGSAGCGKTLLAIEFLVRGAVQHDEPGVFMAFEETAEELTQNVRSLGFDLDDLIARNKLAVDYVLLEGGEIEEAGAYDLEGLFVRLGHAIDTIGAKRVVLDTIEVLFSGLTETAVLRSEIRRYIPLAQREGRNRHRDRRARIGDIDPLWSRRIRLGLRDPARPSRHRASLHPPSAGGQVPWLGPRDQ